MRAGASGDKFLWKQPKDVRKKFFKLDRVVLEKKVSEVREK